MLCARLVYDALSLEDRAGPLVDWKARRLNDAMGMTDRGGRLIGDCQYCHMPRGSGVVFRVRSSRARPIVCVLAPWAAC